MRFNGPVTVLRLSSKRDPRIQLTPHLARMVEHLADGKRVGEIARALGTSADSVYEQLEKVRRRLGARTNPQLIRLAIHHGFLDGTVE